MTLVTLRDMNDMPKKSRTSSKITTSQNNYNLDESESTYAIIKFLWYEYIKRYADTHDKDAFRCIRSHYNKIVSLFETKCNLFDEDCEHTIFNMIRNAFNKKRIKIYPNTISCKYGQKKCACFDYTEEIYSYINKSNTFLARFQCNEVDLLKRNDILTILNAWTTMRNHTKKSLQTNKVGDWAIEKNVKLAYNGVAEEAYVFYDIFPNTWAPRITSHNGKDNVEIKFKCSVTELFSGNAPFCKSLIHEIYDAKRKNLLTDKFQINSVAGRLRGLYIWDHIKSKKQEISVEDAIQNIKNSQNSDLFFISKIKDETLKKNYSNENARITKMGEAYIV